MLASLVVGPPESKKNSNYLLTRKSPPPVLFVISNSNISANPPAGKRLTKSIHFPMSSLNCRKKWNDVFFLANTRVITNDGGRYFRTINDKIKYAGTKYKYQ